MPSLRQETGNRRNNRSQWVVWATPEWPHAAQTVAYGSTGWVSHLMVAHLHADRPCATRRTPGRKWHPGTACLPVASNYESHFAKLCSVACHFRPVAAYGTESLDGDASVALAPAQDQCFWRSVHSEPLCFRCSRK